MLAPHRADYMHIFQYESRYLKFNKGQNLKIADFQGADYRKSKNPNFQILETSPRNIPESRTSKTDEQTKLKLAEL